MFFHYPSLAPLSFYAPFLYLLRIFCNPNLLSTNRAFYKVPKLIHSNLDVCNIFFLASNSDSTCITFPLVFNLTDNPYHFAPHITCIKSSFMSRPLTLFTISKLHLVQSSIPFSSRYVWRSSNAVIVFSTSIFVRFINNFLLTF